MKGLAITALVLTGVSFLIPVFGVFVSLLTSVMALISFRWQPTLSGITVGINLIKTAFLSPSLFIAVGGTAAVGASDEQAVGLYGFYVGWHVVILVAGVLLAITKKKQ